MREGRQVAIRAVRLGNAEALCWIAKRRCANADRAWQVAKRFRANADVVWWISDRSPSRSLARCLI